MSNKQKYNLEKIKLETKNRFKDLEKLRKRNEDCKCDNKSIYYLLYNPTIFINAYSNISKNKGALTKGIKTDTGAMEFFGLKDAEKLSKKFQNQTYQWSALRRTLIPKPGKKKMRPIDTPTQEDRIVQKALRGILEAIFEPEFQQFEKMTKFRATNYVFRQRKSCALALENLKKYGQNTDIPIEGDIKSAYNSIDHSILMKLIKRRVKDKKFLKLINRLLKCGIMEKNHYIHSLNGTPQGGIISPLLFNIYMFPLDKYIFETYISPLPTDRTANKESAKYQKIRINVRKTREKIRETYKSSNRTQLKELRKQFRKLKQEQLNTPSVHHTPTIGY